MQDTPTLGEPTRLLNLRHSTLPYWKVGQGPNLVFVHGWPFDARIWKRVVDLLKDSYTCHLFDLPGAGSSRLSSTTPMNLSAYVDTVLELLDAVGLGDANLGFIGHDSGGSIARLVAATKPERVTGMVFGNTEVPNRYSPLFRRFLWLSRLPLVATLMRYALRFEVVLANMALVGRTPNKAALRRELEQTYFARFQTNERAFHQSMTILKSVRVSDFDQLAEAHARVSAPVHLVWGRRDPWFPLRDAKEMMTTFAGGAKLTVIDDAALMVHEEAPSEFAATVRELFSGAL